MATRGHQGAGGVMSLYDPALSADFKTGIWADCPLLEYANDPSMGMLLDEPFICYDATDDYTLTQATAGTAGVSIAAPGVLEIDSSSTVAGQGANLQRTGGGFVVPAANKTIWFETSIKIDEATDTELFVGMSEVDTAIIDTQANASTNHVGWHSVTGDDVLLFSSEKAGAGTTSAAATLAAATYIKLGFKVTGVTSIQQFINGVAVGTAHATANIPIVKLVPSFICQAAGNGQDPIMHVGGYRIFQLR